MSRQQRLIAKHGEYSAFESAAWKTLGECSVDEIVAACDRYRRHLAAAHILDLKDRFPAMTGLREDLIEEFYPATLAGKGG